MLSTGRAGQHSIIPALVFVIDIYRLSCGVRLHDLDSNHLLSKFEKIRKIKETCNVYQSRPADRQKMTSWLLKDILIIDQSADYFNK